MTFFDLLGLDPKKVVEFFAYFGITVSERTCICFINILALIVIVGFLIYILCELKKYLNKIWGLLYKNRIWRKEYIKRELEHSYADYLQKEKKKCYIPTQCQGTPPHNFDEPDEAVTSSPKEELVSMFINRFFKPNNTNRLLYCILAGSGMGKTTFAVQLFLEYINNYNESNIPYQIFIKDMAEAKVLEEVKRLSERPDVNANQSILILDALDENHKASEDFEKFKEELESVIEPFKFVVITCRAQFFPDEQSVPAYSKIRKNTGDKNLLKYNKLYICPFSPDDIDKYIEKKYNRRDRKKAKAIIEKCKHLMARPVLLSHIDDLIGDNTEYQTEADIYGALIEKWVKREVNEIPDQTKKLELQNELLEFSMSLACKIYTIWKETGEFKLSSQELDDFCRQEGYDTSKYQFKARSLINHDALGAYKFSHKSFLEYFLALKYFHNPSFDFSFLGMDMAELFYEGFCKKEVRDLRNKNIFKIEELNAGVHYLLDELSLTIAKKSDYDYNHIFYVIGNNHFGELNLNWPAYDRNVQLFIEDSGVSSILVSNYRKNTGSLRQLLKARDVSYISIEGDELPNTFIKEARKKEIYVFHNGETIVRGSKALSNASLQLQLLVMQDKQMKIMNQSKIKSGQDSIYNMLNSFINPEEKGGNNGV